MSESRAAGHLTVGAVASRSQLTPRAIRHYDEVGVLRPVFVDPRTGYRYYGEDQVALARRIGALRGLGLGVDAVRAVISAGEDRAAMALALQDHRSRLREQAQEVSAQLAAVEALLLGTEDAPRFTIEVVEVAPMAVATTRWRGVPDDPDLYDGRRWVDLDRAIGEAGGWSLTMLTMLHALDPDVLVDAELGFVTTELLEPTPAFTTRMLDGGGFASMTYTRWTQKTAAYVALDQWLASTGHVVRGPQRERSPLIAGSRSAHELAPTVAFEAEGWPTEVLVPIQ